MSQQILVIVIDPEEKSIRADTIDDNLASMQEMLGGDIERALGKFPDPAEALWVDAEGKTKENFHFNMRGFPEIIAGKAFICREVEGDDGFVNADTDLDVAAVEERVSWLPHLDNQALL